MLPIYRMLAVFCLALASTFAFAQNNFWKPLNGPNGAGNIKGLSSDGSGQLFMLMDDKMYRSADNGDSWVECSDGLPDFLDFEKFLESPSGEFYLSLAYSGGVYRYVSATDSWVLIPINVGTWGSYDAFDIDPQGRFWATANLSNDLIYYSTNEGQSFQQVVLDTQVAGWFYAFVTFNDDHNLIAVSNALYHFDIDGTVQQVISGGPMLYVGYNPNTGTAYCADYDNFKRSADGGLTWQTIKLIPNQQSQPDVQKMTFEPGGRIWAHTNGAMYWSEDDGSTWTRDVAFNNIYGNLFHTDAGDWFIANECYFPNFSRSSDDGATWTDLSNKFQQPSVFDIKKDAAGTLYAKTCRREAYEISNDDGQTWADFVIIDSAATYVSGLAARPDGVMMAVGMNEKYYRSLNNGADWQEMTNVGSLWGASAYYSMFYTDYQGAFYLFEDFGSVWKSTDSGNSWQQITVWTDWYYSPPAFHPNGDIYIADPFSLNLYRADIDSTVWLSIDDSAPFDPTHVHCVTNGMTYVSPRQPLNSASLYRILPDGNYKLEPIPFFNGNFYITGITSNAEGDVFVVADNLIYRSEDDGTTWENIGEMPFTGGTNPILYMAADQFLYAGYQGNVIHRSIQPTAESNFVIGKIWLDNDGDCELDAGETAQPSVAIKAVGNDDYTSFSGYNGHFTLSAPSGNYAVNVQPPNALYEPCLADVPVTLDGPNDSVLVNLPLKAAAQCHYLSINLTTPILRRCFDITYTIRYKNEGTATAEDAFVQVTLDSFFVFQSSTVPVASQNGFTYTFQLGDLAPGQSGQFNIVLKVSCEASLGQTHCINAQIFPGDVCLPTLPLLAFYRECRENIGSFDPNDKRAFVEGREEPGYVLPNTDIEYLIRFQNTGTDTAFRVVVEDRFSTLLDLASVTPLVASHPYTMEMRGQRSLRFVFDNILLPDSNINEAASHGFVKFRVSQMPDVPLGSVIQNEADIFFDFNSPVRTNKSSLIVGTVSTKPEPHNPYSVVAYPNPFEQSITFEIHGPALPSNATLRIFDALGRQVRREEFGATKFSVQRRELETGLYYFLIESDGKRVGDGKVAAK